MLRHRSPSPPQPAATRRAGRLVPVPIAFRYITRRGYYRGSAEVRELAGRPTCTTAGGRTVYGGGGVYPDVVLPVLPTPTWIARVREEDLPLRWVAGYLEAEADRLPPLGAFAADPALPAEAIARFRDFAMEAGVEVPQGAEADDRLSRLLLLRVAAAKWGDAGYHRIAAALDPELAAAMERFDEAEALGRADPAPRSSQRPSPSAGPPGR